MGGISATGTVSDGINMRNDNVRVWICVMGYNETLGLCIDFHCVST